MTDPNLLDAKTRVESFELSELHSIDEWSEFFADTIELLNHPDYQVKDFVMDRMQKGIWAENAQSYRQPGFKPPEAAHRLLPLLDAIAKEKEREKLLLSFLRWSSLSDEQKNVMSKYINELQQSDSWPASQVLTAKIQAELYVKDDWSAAKSFLEPLFEHEDDLLRAAAANAFGEMYLYRAANLPPLNETLEKVKNWEIKRPGFAGAFIGQVMLDSDEGMFKDTNIKVADWVLEIIAKRKSEEPDLPYYNGIDFHAHEIMSCNPVAVGKLIEYGAETVAAMAATEEDRPIEGMQIHLEKLAHSSDDFVARICSWHLAYDYNFLHPEGVKRRYVRLIERNEVRIFLVFNPGENKNEPYAATIYPQGDAISDDVAWKWIDRLIPPEIRPPQGKDLYPSDGESSFHFGGYIANLHGDTKNKIWNRIWIKYPLPQDKWI